MRKTNWARGAAVTGVAAVALAVAPSASAGAQPANPLEGSIQMDVLDSIISNSSELAANPWILSIYGGSIVACLFHDCADDNGL